MIEIKGIIPPILTPMDEEENVNEKELRNQVNRLIGAGVHGIFAFGTNGEGYALNESEKERILEVVTDEARGRVPVYAGSGCITTKDTIQMSQKAKSLGADVLSIITPWFAAASQDDLLEHYREVAKAVDMPIVLYNIPARCGNSLLPATVAKLAEVDNIVGAKDSSGNFDNMLQYIELTKGKDFSILSGNDSLIYWNLLAGGAGGIAGCANVFPENMAGIYNAFVAGNLPQAKIYQDNIRAFRNCFRFGNPNTIVKTAVAMLGYPVGNCRKPFDRISEEGQRAIGQVLEEYRQKGIK